MKFTDEEIEEIGRRLWARKQEARRQYLMKEIVKLGPYEAPTLFQTLFSLEPTSRNYRRRSLWLTAKMYGIHIPDDIYDRPLTLP